LACDGNPLAPPALALGECLAGALAEAVDLLPARGSLVDVIMACNSSHYFWPALAQVLPRWPELARGLRLSSTGARAVGALAAARPRHSLVLCTRGARLGQLFSTAATAAGLGFAEPGPALETLLMQAIYDGIKALDEDRAIEFGVRFLTGV